MKTPQNRLSTGNLPIPLGIVFSDLGTFPLYVFTAVTEGKHFIKRHKYPSAFKFVLLNSRVAKDNNLSPVELLSIEVYRFIKSIGWSSLDDFGLDKINVVEEYIPIEISDKIQLDIRRRSAHAKKHYSSNK